MAAEKTLKLMKAEHFAGTLYVYTIQHSGFHAVHVQTKDLNLGSLAFPHASIKKKKKVKCSTTPLPPFCLFVPQTD